MRFGLRVFRHQRLRSIPRPFARSSHFFLILGVVSAIRLFSPPTPLLFLFSRSHLLIVSRRLFFVFSFLLCPPLLSIRSADHRHTQHMATVREGKIYYEFVSPFGALASTFGRPRRPGQPPCEAEAAAGICEKMSKNFRENYRNSFGPSFPGMACQTLFFRILPAPKNTLFCLCFGAPPDFFKTTIFDFSPIFGLAIGPFFTRFSAKRCFSDFRPVRKYPDFACDLVSFQFFSNHDF